MSNLTTCDSSSSMMSHRVEPTSYNKSFVISQSVMVVGRFCWLLFLLSLFALSFVVWVWVASFQSGWRFWSWLDKLTKSTNYNDSQITIGVVYGLIVLLVSPFFLFVDWTQKQLGDRLPGWMRLDDAKAKVSIRHLFEQKLGIKLGEEFPFFIEAE